ncbi:CBS-domain-containing protein [Naegleria gruberi]|uniref:CBS-domain-containing protein n=1 Tax=Naegleria gruberi TaxID=5762 RepID=D2VSQ1_NAEGR|nr:CBS-domain-containing protein [Naegleria gruberi]EFC40161.1 CBS-domain-containing protein [Naegleria gruberi]|eukprot:XP_002672905.1 CBS-domain-containing protein [Naegleria gruberi strain NEG-M]
MPIPQTCAELKASTSHSKLVVVTPETTLDKCLMAMVENDVRHLVVVSSEDNGKIVGLISERDIRLAIGSPLIHKDMDIKKEIDEFSKQVASSIMTKNVFTVKENDSILEAAKIMRVSRIGCLPIVNDADSIVGVITRSDMLDQLIRVLEPKE